MSSKTILLWLVLTAVFTAAACFLPARLPLAFDWITFFVDAHNIPAFYPPWTAWIVRFLTWPLLIGITLSTYTVAVIKRAQSLASAILAFLVLPLWWTLFLGQLEGLALLGVLGLPWLMPLVLLKPQVAGWVIFSSKRAIAVACIMLVVSLVIWGFWPAKMLIYYAEHADVGRWPQDVSLGLWGLPLAALVLWQVPGWDADKLRLAGACVTPALIPYNLLPLMPALARLSWPWALAVALTSWLPLLANWAGPWAWWLSWLSVALIGAGLRMRQNA